MNISWHKALAAVVVGTLVMFSWRPWQAEPPRETVRVVVLKYLSYAPIFIAQEEGFFEAEGLEVELIPTSGVAAAFPALIDGQVDVVPTSVSPAFFNVVDRGGQMRAVAGKGYNSTEGCAYSGLVARRGLVESGQLKVPSDIAGRRVAIEATGPTYYRVARFLEDGGLTLEDVIHIDVPNPAKSGAFADDSLDLTTASEPWLTRILREGHAVLFARASDHIPDFQFGFLLFGKSLLEDRPETGRRFILAYLKAVQHLNETGKGHGHVGILSKYTRLDEELIEAACWPSIRNDVRIDTAGLERYQEWALEQGLVSRLTDVENVYDPSYVEWANAMIEKTGQSQ